MFYIIVLNIVAANSNFKPKHQAHAFSKFTNEDSIKIFPFKIALLYIKYNKILS
jgi:hypothetical protein